MHRYYLPGEGRFLTEDPVRDGGNWYAYVSGNPVSKVDPTGYGEVFICMLTGIPGFWVCLAILIGLGLLLAWLASCHSPQPEKPSGSKCVLNDTADEGNGVTVCIYLCTDHDTGRQWTTTRRIRGGPEHCMKEFDDVPM